MAELQKSKKLKSGKQEKLSCFMQWVYDFKQRNPPHKKATELLNPYIKTK